MDFKRYVNHMYNGHSVAHVWDSFDNDIDGAWKQVIQQ